MKWFAAIAAAALIPLTVDVQLQRRNDVETVQAEDGTETQTPIYRFVYRVTAPERGLSFGNLFETPQTVSSNAVVAHIYSDAVQWFTRRLGPVNVSVRNVNFEVVE